MSLVLDSDRIYVKEVLKTLHELYPKEVFTYRVINSAEYDGVITPIEAIRLRTVYNSRS